MQAPFETGSEAISEAGAVRESSFCPRPRRRFVLVAAILASALGFIDGSVVAIAIPAIRSDLGASLADAQWISNAYALTLSALILAGGAAGDRFGLKYTFATGIAIFLAASACCAAAPGAWSLIAARAVQGVGAAIMVPGSLAIIAKAYPKQERGKAIGIWAASSALTTALGPVLGGLVLSAFGDAVWRIIFAINLPLGGVALYLLLSKVPADAPGEKRSLDPGGAILATGGFGALAFGLTAISAEAGAQSAVAGAFLVGGLFLIGTFLLWEWRHAEPMVDLSLFRLGPFAGANAATFFLYFSLSAVLFYLPMLLITGWGIGEAATGFIFLPLSLAIALLSGPVGAFSDRTGPRLPIAGGSMVVAVAFGGLAIVTGMGFHGFWTAVFPLMVLMGLGMALVVSPLSTAIMTAVDDKDTGAASGINNAVSRIAGLIAVAAMGSLAAFAYASALGGAVADLPGYGEPAGGLSPEADMLRIAASDSAFAAIAWVTAALSALSALVAWMTIGGKGEREAPAVEAGSNS